MSAASVKHAAPAAVGEMLPRAGWLLACSLWLVPVVFGFGMTSWLGFALIGVLVVRMRWVLLAVAWLVVLSWIGVEADSLPRFLEGLSHGYVDVGLAAPLLVLYLVGVGYGIHANRVWLQILHDRRVRGVRMLGWVAPDAAPARTAVDEASRLEAERSELLTRVAHGTRAYIAREERRLLDLLARAASESAQADAADAADAASASAASAPSEPAPWTSTPLPTSTLSSITLTGLPSGPVDVRTASVEEIAAIPAIGLERATRLVAARRTHPIASIDDIVELLELSALDLVRARPYLKL